MPAEFTPLESASRALALMAARLDPIIERTLAPHLGGLEWTALLTMMDELKGRHPYPCNRADPQPQLRVLTERLGNLGYPFSEGGGRMVSILGSQLRVARNRVAHAHDLSPLDAWRIADAASQLLMHLDDLAGADELAQWRDQILRLEVPEAEDEAGDEPDTASHADDSGSAEEEVTQPDAEVFELDEGLTSAAPSSDVRVERQAYDPWVPGAAGDVSVLDSIRSHQNKAILHAVLEEIVDHEGPIHIDRLAVLSARSFGLRRVEAARVRLIKRHIDRCEGIQVHGDWVWSTDMDPATWTGFRPNDSSSSRQFVEIAPTEIRNAARFLKDRHPNDDQQTHEVRILRTFGRSKKSRKIRDHLMRALG